MIISSHMTATGNDNTTTPTFQVKKSDNSNNNNNNSKSAGSSSNTTTDYDKNADPTAREEVGGSKFKLTITDPDLVQQHHNPSSSSSQISLLLSTVYESSPFLLPISWGAVGGTLLWRGKVKSTLSKQGYDYNTFRLVAKMRGSPMRVKLLYALAETQRNKLQLAQEFNVDWKTVHNHIEVLSRNNFVQEVEAVGTAKYYTITEHGRKILSLLITENKNQN